MDRDILRDGIQLKRSEEEMDAEFEEHNLNIEEILARTQRSFASRSRRCIYEAPEFVKRLNAFEEVVVGDTVVFECQWKAFPRPTIKWYKDDEEITEDPRYDYETDEIQNGVVRLVAKDAKKVDEGAYKCKAENQEGVASTTGYLSVSGGSDSEDKTLASKQKEQQQDKKKLPPDYAASSAPHLRTIIEQQSVEEREAESLRDQPPSPIQDFIDKAQSGRARGVTWPLLTMGYQNGLYPKDDDAESSGSETSVNSQDYDDVSFSVEQEDDVFTEKIPRRELELLGCRVEKSANVTANNHDREKIQDGVKLSRKTPEGAVPQTTELSRNVDKLRHDDSAALTPPHNDLDTLRVDKSLDILDSKWIYFFPLVSSMTFCASAMAVSPLLVILPIMFASFVMFHFLFSAEET